MSLNLRPIIIIDGKYRIEEDLIPMEHVESNGKFLCVS